MQFFFNKNGCENHIVSANHTSLHTRQHSALIYQQENNKRTKKTQQKLMIAYHRNTKVLFTISYLSWHKCRLYLISSDLQHNSRHWFFELCVWVINMELDKKCVPLSVSLLFSQQCQRQNNKGKLRYLDKSNNKKKQPHVRDWSKQAGERCLHVTSYWWSPQSFLKENIETIWVLHMHCGRETCSSE